MPYVVTATSLNLRSAPRVAPATRIAVLPQGHLVEKLDDGPEGWWKVRVTLNGTPLEGFAASEFLAKRAAAARVSRVAPVHLAENRPEVKRSVASGRAFPLGEPNRPRRSGTSRAARLAHLHAIVSYLDVERSARYQPTAGTTFCNIYAYDFCYLAGVYVPRVWWTARALRELAASRPVAVKYDDTVRELNANALYDWLGDFGGDFGWRRVAAVEDVQDAANRAGIGIICAQRKDLNRSGHICVVVPERPPDAAKRVGGAVQLPLQSQAGARNFCYSCGTARWWAGDQFRAFGFWVAG